MQLVPAQTTHGDHHVRGESFPLPRGYFFLLPETTTTLMWFPYFVLNVLFLCPQNLFLPLLPHTTEDNVILELQNQVRKLKKQMSQLKKAMKGPLCFDGNSLDPTMYLRWIQMVEE